MGHFNISCELQKLNVEKSVENVDNFLWRNDAQENAVPEGWFRKRN